ncbi:MAG: hypothetical protein SH850_01160 [Planctomycetaceae bacterium]|nr:hypothetical protein [Planctomycetaceae bacterium]
MRRLPLVVMFSLMAMPLHADEPAANEAKAWTQRRHAEFLQYQIAQRAADGETALKFEPTSLLSWSNPLRETPAGAVYLWTLDGRPRLIASTYPYTEGIEQELTSLSELPLVARRDGQPLHRFTPGIEWKPVPDADPPVASRSLRLTQMRRIAERFRVTGGDGNKSRKFEARQLTQPIYRAPADARADAALFAFVQGTDPEAVLLVEAVDSTGWRYALARMTVVPIAADLDDARVWELPSNWSIRTAQDQPFRTVQLPGAQ